MFNFDDVDKEIDEELTIKMTHMKDRAWNQKAKEQGITLARTAVQDQINEAKMSLSLLDAQTKEFSYVKTVIDQLDSILGSMPSIDPYGDVTIGTMPNGTVGQWANNNLHAGLIGSRAMLETNTVHGSKAIC